MKKQKFQNFFILCCFVTWSLLGCQDTHKGTKESFSLGMQTLTAHTIDSGGAKVTTVAGKDGNTLLQMRLHETNLDVERSDTGDINQLGLSASLPTTISDMAINRLAIYMAGPLVQEDSDDFTIADSPGCDWFPDTRCTLGCCAQHDACFDTHDCTWLSWFLPWPFSSIACINCNNVAAECIVRGCAGLAELAESDLCYDHRCDSFYSCYDGDELVADCECPSPCDDVSPSTCGNGSCEVGETTENCFSDCSAGNGVNQCCLATDNCPSEGPFDCPGDCCCCGFGEICGEDFLCTEVDTALYTEHSAVHPERTDICKSLLSAPQI